MGGELMTTLKATVYYSLKGESFIRTKLGDKPFEIKNVRFQIINEIW